MKQQREMTRIVLTERGWWFACMDVNTKLQRWYGPYRYKWLALLANLRYYWNR